MNATRSRFAIVVTLLAVQPLFADQLPEGNNGLAAKYAGDVGIERDPAVIFADDFEDYTDKAGMGKIWNAVYNKTRIAQEKDNVYLGQQSIEFSVPENRVMASGAAHYILDNERKQDVVFLRYYSKFASSYDVQGSSHNGGGISARMYNHQGQTSAGTKADGKNHFAIMLDHGRWEDFGEVANPGYLGIYIYHLGQRHRWGDGFFPTGMVIPNSSLKADFGPDFVSRQNIVTRLGTWHCHEVMLKANTPGKKDGRVAAWVDGNLAMDFPNLQFRGIESLKIDHLQIGLNINTKQHPATKKWYDNVVAATSYIGPVSQAKAETQTATERPTDQTTELPDNKSIARIAGKIEKALKSDRWHQGSTDFAATIWKDFAHAHVEKAAVPAEHRIAGHEIDIKSYDEYLGTYGKQKLTVVREKNNRFFVQLGQEIMPAVAIRGMILVATGDLATSLMPQLGDKPYATLEIYCLARVKGEYYLFHAHEKPTEFHRIKRLTKE